VKFDDVRELNVEGYPSEDFLALVRDVLPEQVTLVPDAENQRTSDHGWEVFKNRELLQPIVSDLSEWGMRVALFVEPHVQDVRDAWRIGAHRIELYTEHYARAFDTGSFEHELLQYCAAAEVALDLGLEVNADHDLNLQNIVAFKERIPQIAGVGIGHALTADAIHRGFRSAVSAYLAVLH